MRYALSLLMFPLMCMMLSSCKSDKDVRTVSGPVISTDRENLSTNLVKARQFSMKTGLPVTIRMKESANMEDVKDDQAYAEAAIVNNYGKGTLLETRFVN